MESSRKENYAETLFEIVKNQYDEVVELAKKEGKEVKLECACDFGQVTVISISACTTANVIRMEVQYEDKNWALILTDASRCAFHFSFVPATEKRVPVGFGPIIQKTKMT